MLRREPARCLVARRCEDAGGVEVSGTGVGAEAIALEEDTPSGSEGT